MERRGQFYLVAALVIIGVISGLASVYIRASILKEDTTVYDLSEEIQFEGSHVLDYGVFNDLTDEQIVAHLGELTEFYARSNPEQDLIAIYGNTSTIVIISYIVTETGSVSISLGGSESTIRNTQGQQSITTIPREEGIVSVELDDETVYEFELRTGQTLYIILKKERRGETFIAAPGEPDAL